MKLSSLTTAGAVVHEIAPTLILGLIPTVLKWLGILPIGYGWTLLPLYAPLVILWAVAYTISLWNLIKPPRKEAAHGNNSG